MYALFDFTKKCDVFFYNFVIYYNFAHNLRYKLAKID